MEGVTDTVFRQVVMHTGRPDVFMTEFTNSASFASEKGRYSTRGRLAFQEKEKPLVAQIWGTEPKNYEYMSKELAKMGFTGIDINMGCPVKDVTKTGACSALIENHELAAELIAAAKKGGLPVSVKTRAGFKTRKTRQWVKFLLEQDIAALTLHARTAKEMSKVPAQWEDIGEAVKVRNEVAPDVPIIGNGDVENRQHGEKLAREFDCDGIMIGRGIFTNPFCFEKEPKTHSREELLNLLKLHLDLFDQESQSYPRKFDPLKRFFKIYVRDFPGASEIRDKLMHTKNTAEVRELLKKV
jgi:tRNA-dihydrouridine synthase